MKPASHFSLSMVAGVLFASACATSSSTSSSMSPAMSSMAPSPDPRVGQRAGWFDAQEASWNLGVVSKTRPSAAFINESTPGDRRLVNSDLAFTGNYAIQGNYSGYQVWDISDVRHPTLTTAYVCPGSQSDVSVYRNLMFVSGESTTGRLDCGMQGVADTVSGARLRGIRIFDVSDMVHPKYVGNVQTCRGSHTHTVVTDPKDQDNVYIYVSGSAAVRSPTELPGCVADPNDPATALFRIEVIRVPLAHPEQAAIVSHPRIFADNSSGAINGLGIVSRHADPAADVAAAATARAARAGGPGGAGSPPARVPGITQCHDITVYPEIGLAGGACAGMGLLLDIRNVANPVRIAAVADSNFSFWHSATFNNDGTKILFSDEWGGGSQPRCRATDNKEWGADAIFALENNKMTFKSYYKMPAAQTSNENCVAHNGSLIPVPGRDIMVQSWYQGGISVFDWTDASHPMEIAYFDYGPMDATKLVDAGYWSSYWYNGVIVGSEISRGLDIFELKPSAWLTQNEIDAAKLVHFDHLNVQDQPKLVWPASFVVARAYVDQLRRGNGLSAERLSAVSRDLDRAEKLVGSEQRAAMSDLSIALVQDSQLAPDGARVRMLAGAVGKLAKVQP
ncbi:MAG: hypothetical protein M3Z05_07975 [Gemmatimonadota bacterium]|nr:hypothetical protein [Gemmatimonadota bacterium]